MKAIKLILILLLCAGAVQVQAQRNNKPAPGAKQKVKAKRCIRRTAVVIVKAHKQVKENKNYTGDLSKAVRHQRYAKHLYKKGNFVRAIHQSRMARRLAFAAIKANKGVVDKKDDFDKDDNVNDNAPSDTELSNELPPDNVTDQDLINEEISDVDLSDND